jgi:hypothetical protein
MQIMEIRGGKFIGCRTRFFGALDYFNRYGYDEEVTFY